MLWSGESYAAVTALCLHDPAALDGLIAAAQRDGLTGCLNVGECTLLPDISQGL